MKEPTPEEEESARAYASEAFHEDPSNPSSCEKWQENDHAHRRCPCEDGWRRHMIDVHLGSNQGTLGGYD